MMKNSHTLIKTFLDSNKGMPYNMSMLWIFALSQTSCTAEKEPLDLPESKINTADIYQDILGEPIPSMHPDLLESYYRGQEMMERVFTTENGLGPTFNADSCASCHQQPVAGGSAPRYRDFWLVQSQRWDGALEAAGSNGASPVRNLYSIPPHYHTAPTDEVAQYARRNTPPMFGVGLFAFVLDEDILANIDPNDEDGNGISGRANYEKGAVGRFGYKSQAATLESFNRGAMFNQMGITSDPLFYEFREILEYNAAGWNHLVHPNSLYPQFIWSSAIWTTLIPSATAQVAALDEPTIDLDDALDPEISFQEQQDLLVFSTYLAVPPPIPEENQSNSVKLGQEKFFTIGCADCHLPILPSIIGDIPAYTDLLLHDMGDELGDGIKAGFASGNEFRTQPLWAVSLHHPYLHDGRADSLQEAIEYHGGESAHSRDSWLALPNHEKQAILDFLESLGGGPENRLNKLNNPDFQIPEFGDLGGPDQVLSTEEQQRFLRGLELFDQNYAVETGLSPKFNADSCRACHQDPVLGGAGGIDTNVIRIGHRDENGLYSSLDFSVMNRSADPNNPPLELPNDANIIEWRQPPSLLGLGWIESVSEESILANADPEDLDGNGISGRARYVDDYQLGRFGWKLQVPSIRDFTTDALLNEVGLTIHPSWSTYTVVDDFDACADPEVPDADFQNLEFFIKHLAAPLSTIPPASTGSQLFEDIGCAACHIPTLDNIPLYSDLLLHDMGGDLMHLVEQDGDVAAQEFRTPPLWGIQWTAPYLHDGSAATLHAAILQHAGEGLSSKEAFEQLNLAQQEDVLNFLENLSDRD